MTHVWKMPGPSLMQKYPGMPGSDRGMQSSKPLGRDQVDLESKSCRAEPSSPLPAKVKVGP